MPFASVRSTRVCRFLQRGFVLSFPKYSRQYANVLSVIQKKKSPNPSCSICFFFGLRVLRAVLALFGFRFVSFRCSFVGQQLFSPNCIVLDFAKLCSALVALRWQLFLSLGAGIIAYHDEWSDNNCKLHDFGLEKEKNNRKVLLEKDNRRFSFELS